MHSSFTQVKNLLVNWNLALKHLTSSIKTTPLVFVASNKPIVTWKGTQFQFKKLTMSAKVLTPIQFIHKSIVTKLFHIVLRKVERNNPCT